MLPVCSYNTRKEAHSSRWLISEQRHTTPRFFSFLLRERERERDVAEASGTWRGRCVACAPRVIFVALPCTDDTASSSCHSTGVLVHFFHVCPCPVSQKKNKKELFIMFFFYLSSFPLVWRNPRQMRCNNNNNQRRQRRILKKSRFISSFFSFFWFWNTIHNRQRDAQLEIRNTTTTNPLWATDVFNF